MGISKIDDDSVQYACPCGSVSSVMLEDLTALPGCIVMPKCECGKQTAILCHSGIDVSNLSEDKKQVHVMGHVLFKRLVNMGNCRDVEGSKIEDFDACLSSEWKKGEVLECKLAPPIQMAVDKRNIV